MVTSNHIHLLVYDNYGPDVIPKSMQLIAGRTGQEYNTRKQRKGAFWEDRCLVYPNAAKSGELQSQGLKGEAVIVYRNPLTTQDLKFSGFPAG